MTSKKKLSILSLRLLNLRSLVNVTLIGIFISISIQYTTAQTTLNLSIEDVVALSKDQVSDELKKRITLSIQAPDAQIIQTQLSNNYWQYRSFLANYKPQITLNTRLPSFSRTIDAVTQPNGTLEFLPFSNMRNSVSVSLSQVIPQTGGSIFATTGLQRVDIFQDAGNTVSYLNNPIQLGFNQPIFAFNDLKWDKIIEPMRFQEAKRQYREDLEAIAADAVRLFFDVYIARINQAAARKDKANADTLYIISQGRYNVGRIAETELLQIEISKLNADAALSQATLDLQTSTENLRNFLGFKEAVNFELFPPTTIPDVVIDPQLALKYANENRSQIIAFQRRLKEAERNLDRAEKNNGFNTSISGSIGFSQAAQTLSGAYQELTNQQFINLSVQVPIMDWGRAQARKEIATSNKDLTIMRVAQDKINFERDILLKVQQFDLVRAQTKLALKKFEVAQKTYDLTRKRYLIGKIGVIDLNLALADQDRNRQSYMSALRSFWTAYYQIRRLTLYDFINQQPLNTEMDAKFNE